MTDEIHIHKPPNTLLRIDEMWAFISSDETGEGVCGMSTANGGLVAMVAADQRRVDSLMPIARMMAMKGRTRIKLVRFTVREEIMEIDP